MTVSRYVTTKRFITVYTKSGTNTSFALLFTSRVFANVTIFVWKDVIFTKFTNLVHDTMIQVAYKGMVIFMIGMRVAVFRI